LASIASWDPSPHTLSLKVFIPGELSLDFRTSLLSETRKPLGPGGRAAGSTAYSHVIKRGVIVSGFLKRFIGAWLLAISNFRAILWVDRNFDFSKKTWAILDGTVFDAGGV
jgi:hypothetical protein